MSTINDGGPAFPHYYLPGMTLRDYFAGCALQGLCANSDINGSWENLAKSSYGAADAMIKARQPAPADGAQGSAEGEEK